MRLNDEERAMLAGEHGEPRRRALELQVRIGRVFDAPDFVEVGQAHVMADTESLGEAGVEYLESLAGYGEAERRVRVPTITDPRGIDFCAYRRLGQKDEWAALEQRAIDAMRALGILMTDTCINYQTISPPVFGEHAAFGDTGVVIYANSVCGARSNFEGGPAAVSAGLTGRTPRYGCHLDRHRRGTHLFEAGARPETLNDWGALGAIVGRAVNSYWHVPVVAGIDGAPTSDALKHFGAALASYGSVPMFHMIGVTPEAPGLDHVFDARPERVRRIGRADLDGFHRSFGRHEDGVDVVVFAAPQLSLAELQGLADLLRGRRIHPDTAMLIATSPENKAACDRMGFTGVFEDAGALLLRGVCFYQMRARELGEANGWRRLLTNSAKLVNIIQGYGYEPVIASMEACVDAAVRGRY